MKRTAPAQDNVNCQVPWINAEKVEDSKDGVAFHKPWYTSTKHAFSHLNEVIDGDTKLRESDGDQFLQQVLRRKNHFYDRTYG